MDNFSSHGNYEIKDKKYYLGVGILGLILSVLWVTLVNTVSFSDFHYYYKLAVDIANGGAWGDTYTSVGYPIVLGGIFKMFGASLILAKTFNILLTLIGYYLVYSILNKLNIGDFSKKIIYLFYVIFPLNIYYNSVTGTEILFATLLLLFTNLYFGKNKYRYVILGLVGGLTTMVKPFFLLAFLAIFMVDLISSKRFLNSLKNSLIGLLVALIVIAPWCYRNTKLTGQITFVSNNGGIVSYINNNSQNTTGTWMAATDVENSIVKTEEYKNANMTKKNKMLSNASKKWIKNHPKRFIQLGFLRLKSTYHAAGDSYYATYGTSLTDAEKKQVYDIANIFKSVTFYLGIIFVLGYSIYILMNLFRRKSENIDKFLLYSCVIFYMFTCTYFLTEGQPRYSFPLIFFMISIIIYLENNLVKRYRR